MAVVQYSALITQIRGKLGGSVFSKFHQGFSMYRKANPSKFGSDTQQQVRSYFSAFAGTWATLTGSQRADWNFVAENTPLYNRLAELRTISGYAYYIKLNQFLRDAGQGIVRDIAVTLNPAYALSLSVSNFTAQPGPSRFQINTLNVQLTTISNSADANTAIIYASLPKSYTDFKYYQSWYRVAFLALPANLGVNAVRNFALVGIEMPQGWRVFNLGDIAFRCEIVNNESAQFSASTLAYDSVVVVPPTIFPRLSNPDPFVESALFRQNSSTGFWELAWTRNNAGSDTLDFEIECAIYIGNAPFVDAPLQSYIVMYVRPILQPNPASLFRAYNSSNAVDTGQDVVDAFSGVLPAVATGVNAILRTRTRKITGGPFSPPNYQQFGYQTT